MYSFLSFNVAERDRWVATQAAAIPSGSRVLDVGAGRGRYRSLFTHCEYLTHDFGKEPNTIGEYTALDYESDITSIPVHDNSFDVVLCTEVLEHVPRPILALQEIARILRLGGKLILTAPLGAALHQEPYHFYGGFTPYWYYTFLPEAAMDVISIEANRGFFSWFGQESARFSGLLNPLRTLHAGWSWPLLTVLWLGTLPYCRILFPLLGGTLDKLGLEHIATVGYHIVAVRR